MPAQHPRRRATQLRRFLVSERGTANAVSWVLLFPLMLAVLFIGVQGMLVYQAKAIALAAAQDGARTAAAYQSSAQAGQARAETVMALNHAGLHATSVHATRTETAVTVTVTTTPNSLFPGVDWPVTQSATLPVERLT